MGKKGGKKEKANNIAKIAEPNLPTIPEEEPCEKNSASVESKNSADILKGAPERKSKSILKPSSTNKLDQNSRKDKKSKSLIIDEKAPNISNELEVGDQSKKEDVNQKADGKKKTGKKGKKEKPQHTEDQDEETPAKKSKKDKKAKPEAEDKSIPSSKVELRSSMAKPEQKDQSTETSEIGKPKKGKKEKGKKNEVKIDEGEEVKDSNKEEERDDNEVRRGSQFPDKRPSSLMRRASQARKRSGSIKVSSSYGLFSSPLMRFDAQKRKYASKISQSSDSSSDSEESRIQSEESSKKKKGKKGKEKGKKGDKKEEEELGEEEKEKRRAAKEAEKKTKEAEKKAKKEAEKAARKEAQAKAGKTDKPKEAPQEDIRKKLEDLKKIAKDLGIEVGKMVDLEPDEEGPKKKASKKEKAKMTAEMAEKAKQEMEAQAKRLEEIIKKRKEEERQAAIERDKKETIEQVMRMEQLRATTVLIQEIIDTNANISKEEKDLLEWQKYVECGKLPNPALCDQMNTYLHLWKLDLENTSIEDASNRTTDVVKLLSELDELIDTTSMEESPKLENWKWIRQLFRKYQSASLDVASYRLLRDVEHNLNRINIPTADFSFKDDYVTLYMWLRVMLPIPLPNPRRPPKPRVDITFQKMDLSVLFPSTIDCENAAIRGMYLKYDHLSDLSSSFNMPDVPEDYFMNLLDVVKKEWRTKLKYKYNNRDKIPKSAGTQQENGSSVQDEQNIEEKPGREEEKPIKQEESEELGSDDEIPLVPFKQLKPTASEHAIAIEDQLYDDTRTNLLVTFPENVINLRKFVILGGLFHLNLLAQPPQPQDFITLNMTITGLYLPKQLEILPFKVVYTPYIPPEPEPSDSSTSIRKLPEELEEEIKKQEDELDKLIAINIKWPQHVIFLELPIVCRWDEDNKQWSNEEIHDVKHNEDKCMISFRTGVFGIYALASYKYSNLPFQAYDIKPEIDESVTVQLTAAILMLEFNIKDGLIAITQLQNSPNMTLQDTIGKYMKLHKLKRKMKEAGIDIFPTFDAFCYVDGCCEKQWAMEQHLYYNMAQISNSFNFAWSRWNLQAGRRKIVLQMRQYSPEKGKQKNHQMLLVTPLKATFIECTEVSQAFSEKDVESLKFCSDLYHLMRSTNGIFVKNKVSKASKQNIYTLAQFLISIRVLSFS